MCVAYLLSSALGLDRNRCAHADAIISVHSTDNTHVGRTHAIKRSKLGN